MATDAKTSAGAAAGAIVGTSKLGPHHFAYLRAVAEGLRPVDAARRYLAMEHGAEVAGLHRRLVDQVRAVARRRGDARWRLIGIELPSSGSAPGATPGAGQVVPSIDDWADAEGLSDWSYGELQALYEERFAPPTTVASDRRRVRNSRLRAQRLDLLRTLEATAAVAAQAMDSLDGWLPLDLAHQLRQLGDLTLADLRARIGRGGRWWLGLRAYGPGKAARLAGVVDRLLGPATAPACWPTVASPDRQALSGVNGSNRFRGLRALEAVDDAEAVKRWVAVRAGSDLTAKQYLREADRWLLFCALERGRAMSDATEVDCRAYMDFLAQIPDKWISRRKVKRMAPGWAPFSGQLSLASRKLALTIVASMMGWMVTARYLVGNPWVLVNRRLGDDANLDDDITSRAFTVPAWNALLAYLDGQPATEATARLRWLCVFGHSVGLRASELLASKREHLRKKPGGWLIRVLGKGRRNRTVPVPGAAITATRKYFAARGLSFDEAHADTPLIASLIDGGTLTYSTLNEVFTRFVRAAIDASDLPIDDKAIARRASVHWLRHTYGTRAAEAEISSDILQENFGHADPRTTSLYYRAQIERRQLAMQKVFGD